MLILKKGEFEKNFKKNLERARYEDVIIEEDSSKTIVMSLDKYVEIMRELKKYKEEYFSYIEKYLNSNNPWEIRYGIITMFEYKEDKKYLDDILVRLKNINYDHYYVKMAKAWLTAELFAFHKDEVFNFLRKNYYDKETFLMTCSKIRDSRRVSDKDKEEIKEFKKVSLDKL